LPRRSAMAELIPGSPDNTIGWGGVFRGSTGAARFWAPPGGRLSDQHLAGDVRLGVRERPWFGCGEGGGWVALRRTVDAFRTLVVGSKWVSTLETVCCRHCYGGARTHHAFQRGETLPVQWAMAK